MAFFDLFKKKTPPPPADGLATVYAPDGSIFRGKFRNGLREGSGYTYVVKGKTCTSYRCAYRNGVRHGCCTVMTCAHSAWAPAGISVPVSPLWSV